jgi:hypothetical protein
VPVCSATNEQRRPVIIMGGPGGAIVAWEDFRSGANMDIFALEIDGSSATAAGDTPPPSNLAVTSNYPNPFSADTRFDLDLATEANVTVDVYDVGGRRVRHVELGRLSPGARMMRFDGLDDGGKPLASGMYFYRVHSNRETVTRKMVIAR